MWFVVVVLTVAVANTGMHMTSHLYWISKKTKSRHFSLPV